MKDAGKFFRKMGLYLASVVAVLYLLGNCDRLLLRNNSHAVYGVQNARNYDSLDFLVLGNSYAYSDIASYPFDSLGLKYYNLGIPSASSYYYEILWNDYRSHAKTAPANILMMVSPVMFSNVADDWEQFTIHRSALVQPLSNEWIFRKYDIGIKAYCMLVQKSAETGIENIYYRIRGEAFYPYDNFKDTKGFVVRRGVMTARDTLDPHGPWALLRNQHFRYDKFTYLLNLARELRKEGINVIFYEPPTYHTERYFRKEFLTSYQNALRMIHEEKYTFIGKSDMEDLILPENYRDIDHMNEGGARLYTSRMIAMLKERKIIRD